MNLYGNSKCKRNSLPDPMSNGSREVSAHRRLEASSTPGRPVFSFNSVANLSRKTFPSKWDDAEKWLMTTSSPPYTHTDNFQVSAASLDLDHHDTLHASNGISCSAHIMLKDRFTDSAEPIFRNLQYSEPTKEGVLIGGQAGEVMKDASKEVVHKDVGTEMTPLGSCTTSRCHTPFKSSSPARHNTPANRSGPLSFANHNNTTCTIDLIRLEECHFAKLQLGTQYDSVTPHWSTREEEEEQISKSLRHNADSECKAAKWEEEEKTKSCVRYQREEAKIQAWVDLQSAKAEAQSKKLEVKIEKMRSKLEEKLMKRMAVVHRKAEEWRAAGREKHLEQMEKTTEQAQKIMKKYNPLVACHNSCGCLPCSDLA